MHIPDGFLAPPVWLTLNAISAPAVAWVARRSTPERDSTAAERPRLPLIGVMGAFIFAAQMVNFPVAFGVSGHLLGGSLLAIVLGPASAALTMTAVLVLQAVLFQDGGILALGANVLNMALAGVAVGYIPVRLWGHTRLSVFAGGALSVLASGALALWQLILSGVAIEGAALAIAIGIFLVTGFMEGIITVAALGAITRLSPGAIPARAPVSLRARMVVAAAGLMLVTGGAWIASAAPDGLQHLAAALGLEDRPVWTEAPFAGYEWSGFGPDWVHKPAAGLVGLACVYAVCSIGGKKR